MVGFGCHLVLGVDPLGELRGDPLAIDRTGGGGEGRLAAIFGLVGAINLPIIHFSVQWWNTLHQGESIELTGSSIAPELLWPLPLTLLGFSALFGAAVLMRMRTELAHTRIEARLKRMTMSNSGGAVAA